MATKISTHGKEKPSLSSSRSLDPPRVRRAPKPLTAGSPERDSSIVSGKQSKPNYLSRTVSSTAEASKSGRKQASEPSTTKRWLPRGFLDKNSPQPQKTTVSANPREKPVKSSPTMPKTAISHKPTSDKTTKVIRNGKTQPSMSKIPKKEISGPRKGETKVPSKAAASTSPDVTEKPNILADQEEITSGKEAVLESVKVEGEENGALETPPSEYQTGDNATISRPVSPENKTPNVPDSVPAGEEHDREPTVEKLEDKDEEPIEDSIIQKDQEQGGTNDQHEDGEDATQTEETQTSETSEDIKERGEKEGKGEDGNLKTGPVDSSEEKTQELDYQQVQENTDWGEKDAESEKIKEREVLERAEDHKQEGSVRKKQVKAKKESQAYNDVIEKTANKLGERKNRVLALAGAFETVISLHESEAQGTKGKD